MDGDRRASIDSGLQTHQPFTPAERITTNLQLVQEPFVTEWDVRCFQSSSNVSATRSCANSAPGRSVYKQAPLHRTLRGPAALCFVQQCECSANTPIDLTIPDDLAAVTPGHEVAILHPPV